MNGLNWFGFLQILIIGFVSISLTGCRLTLDELIGRYSYQGSYGVSSEITLNSDTTYVLKWQQGLNYGTKNGLWKIDQNKIILLGDPDYESKKEYLIIREEMSNENGIKLKVVDELGYPIYLAFCVVENGQVMQSATTDTLGEVSFNINTFQIITITNAGYYTVHYEPKRIYNKLEIELIPKTNEINFDKIEFRSRKNRIVSEKNFFLGKIDYNKY